MEWIITHVFQIANQRTLDPRLKFGKKQVSIVYWWAAKIMHVKTTTVYCRLHILGYLSQAVQNTNHRGLLYKHCYTGPLPLVSFIDFVDIRVSGNVSFRWWTIGFLLLKFRVFLADPISPNLLTIYITSLTDKQVCGCSLWKVKMNGNELLGSSVSRYL